jgi:hypothetical protein
MSAATLLDRLESVRRTGPYRWLARCPAHKDRRPSLSIRESDAATVLVHCFAGCDVASIAAAAGLELSDLFPPRSPDVHASQPRASRLSPLVAAFERDLMIVHILLADLAQAKPIADADRRTAADAAARVWSALQEGRHVL